ncbi:Hsp20/alpha crystallin family protein [Arthrobacter sp. ISL-72]|uniref:Hsp20/alpha crystallin family protein n=1 Tax=Arthrobacter sp. ISL-72 TaxID=2819114 RepID=UPI001BE9D05C|nr:Hsp20/alpha crystallin family protein [Arthrobacter sp. ISL-72]MBT2595923.1 Hsp20/alpha crystallin family protein [Arthrobacter sp. ISL-72]
MLMLDPFRRLDRLAEQVLGTAAHPAAMPMDAWREGDEYIVALDLPGVAVDSIDLGVEKNVLTVRAERKDVFGKDTELVAAERPRGVFSRQLILGDAMEADKVKASYDAGVLTLRIPVAAQATPRKIEIETKGGQQAFEERHRAL